MTSTIVALLLLAQDLPKAETVLAHFIEVTGGRAEYDKIHSSVSTGKLEMPAQGIKGSITIYEATPDKQFSVAEIPGIGSIEDGTNGTIAWEKSALQGARLKEGDEKAAAIRAANSETKFLNWKKYYKSIETTGIENVDGKPCYRVVLTPLEGKPEMELYEKSSGLLLKESGLIASPMGEVPVETLVSDYRKEGALLMPHKLKQGVIGQQFEITVDTIKFNVDIPSARFEPPADVKALIK